MHASTQLNAQFFFDNSTRLDQVSFGLSSPDAAVTSPSQDELYCMASSEYEVSPLPLQYLDTEKQLALVYC